MSTKKVKKTVKNNSVTDDGQLPDLVEKCRQLDESLKRSQADFANYKRRSEEERKGLLSLAKMEVVLSFLPVYESCRRAAVVLGNEGDGVKMILDSFENILHSYSIKKMGPDMDTFDPHLAEAVGFKEGNKANNGKVAEVVEMGFMMEDQVIKPAKVLIYKA
ncbi:MAG: nucleotide exchange factor GrpE [Patescibacteria group bacterium]